MTTENKFSGIGWQFPPEFSKSDLSAMVAQVSGPENISQSLRALLTTNVGERLMHPEYGCGLAQLLFEPIDQRTITKIQNSVNDAILLYEPRIKLIDVSVFQDPNDTGLLNINIEYIAKTTNSRFNMVYPFHINEANAIA